MGDSEHEVYQDEAEVEIMALDAHGGQQQDTPVAAAAARLSLRAQLSPRQRVLRLVVTTGIFMLALVIVLSSIAPIRSGAIGLLIGPKLTADATAEYFYFDASPSWGKLFVDGQPLAHPPVMDNPIYLSPGRHQLVWRAEPFQLQSCALTVPVSSDSAAGSCHAVPTQQNESGLIHAIKKNSWQVFFYESLNTLSSVLRTALVRTAQSALDAQQSTETVYAGEQYLIGGGHTIATAREPLHATLRFQLGTPAETNSVCATAASACSVQGPNEFQNCLWFCTSSNEFEYRGSGWFVQVIVHALWDYTTLDGRVSAHDQPAAVPAAYQPDYAEPGAVLRITWDGHNWHVVFVQNEEMGSFNPVCQSAYDVTNGYPAFLDAVNGNTHASVSVSSVSGSVYAQGCLLILQAALTKPTTSIPSPTATMTAYCLYRFGVLRAGNKLAHHFWPQMPLADAYERDLVQQWSQFLKPVDETQYRMKPGTRVLSRHSKRGTGNQETGE